MIAELKAAVREMGAKLQYYKTPAASSPSCGPIGHSSAAPNRGRGGERVTYF